MEEQRLRPVEQRQGRRHRLDVPQMHRIFPLTRQMYLCIHALVAVVASAASQLRRGWAGFGCGRKLRPGRAATLSL